MDVFALRDSIIGEYERFATSFTTIRAVDLRTKLRAFYDAGTYWPEPLIHLNPLVSPLLGSCVALLQHRIDDGHEEAKNALDAATRTGDYKTRGHKSLRHPPRTS